MDYESSKLPKLGKISENDWKESASITIATEAFEENRKIKTYFTKQDKRPNLDGSLSIVENQEEIITVEVQIKTLPEDYSYKKVETYPYRYLCDTKVFGVVMRKTTLNPVALVMVDRNKRLVFVKLLTEDYVKDLNITNQRKKIIGFSDDDILDIDKFIFDVKKYRGIQARKGITTETPVYVNIEAINKELNRKRNHYHDIKHDGYYLVYTRNNIRGYLSNFLYDGERKHPLILLKFIDGIIKDNNFKPVHIDYDECLEEEWIQIIPTKEVLTVKRSIQRTTASDLDVMNVLYDIARLKQKNLIYYSAGKPLYMVEGSFGGLRCPLFQLNAEEIEKEW